MLYEAESSIKTSVVFVQVNVNEYLFFFTDTSLALHIPEVSNWSAPSYFSSHKWKVALFDNECGWFSDGFKKWLFSYWTSSYNKI